jgi:hypothetical protein
MELTAREEAKRRLRHPVCSSSNGRNATSPDVRQRVGIDSPEQFPITTAATVPVDAGDRGRHQWAGACVLQMQLLWSDRADLRRLLWSLPVPDAYRGQSGSKLCIGPHRVRVKRIGSQSKRRRDRLV